TELWYNGKCRSSNRFQDVYFSICDLKDKKRTETALKAGEDRAILLALYLQSCSACTYYVLIIAIAITV
uniref:Uncharacterized protein n=1 Tax=Sinocyclocheilus rhinocerous TaxID=307959 RepID=A0A673N3K4_9TELE